MFLTLFLRVSLCKSLGNLKILLSSSLTIKGTNHDFLLLVGDLVERLSKLHDRHGTFSISNSAHALVYRDGGKWGVTDLLTVGTLVLTIVEIPDIKETINSGQVKETRS